MEAINLQKFREGVGKWVRGEELEKMTSSYPFLYRVWFI